MFVATLIAAGKLTGEVVRDAIDRMAHAGLHCEAPHWIDDGDALDLHFSGSLVTARHLLTDWVKGMDVVIQPAADRRKKLLIADMDSTMITVECIDELADYAGIKPQVAAITERAMRGELDFQAALIERVRLLGGMPETVLADCLDERVDIMAGAHTLVQTMKAHQARAVLVSGGFLPFAQPVADRIGFDRAQANQLEVVDGRLTGRVIEPIFDSGGKLSAMVEECIRMGILPAQVLAVGDGANDIPIITSAGLGIAFHAHPAAAAAADAAIRHHDLTALLWAQGYPRAEWTG